METAIYSRHKHALKKFFFFYVIAVLKVFQKYFDILVSMYQQLFINLHVML